MKVLITAGSTQVPIDQVRCISNIFKGRTGADIAHYFVAKKNEVTLITSDKHALEGTTLSERLTLKTFRTYDELFNIMRWEVIASNYDVIIHSAAVSDYRVSGVCLMEGGQQLELAQNGKISSSHEEIYLRLTPTQKIIDLIRSDWFFTGYLVKFKLQVNMTDQELIKIATKSRTDSQADMIVANCLEWSKERAYIITEDETTPVGRDYIGSSIYQKITNK